MFRCKNQSGAINSHSETGNHNIFSPFRRNIPADICCPIINSKKMQQQIYFETSFTNR